MSGWGIAETAPEIEKIKAESADYLHGLNSCGEIPWEVYDYAFDFYAELIQKAYELGKSEAEPHWIPVEQELPKIGEYVLCETTARYFGKYHVCKFVDKDKWVDKPHFDWDSNGFPHVIAWTRFEPYKGVTE